MSKSSSELQDELNIRLHNLKMSEGVKESGQVLKPLGPEMDKNKLLLLGLNLLNRGLRLPCAVVHPQTKAPVAEKAPSQLMEKLKSSPPSPQRLSALDEATRKRKRDPANDDLSEVDRREKRCPPMPLLVGMCFISWYALLQENDE